MLNGHPFSLCRALSEAKPKAKAELSASQFGTLNECELKANPETLARDLKYLTKKGYEMKRAVGVDLFPMTVHVESVVLMQYCGK